MCPPRLRKRIGIDTAHAPELALEESSAQRLGQLGKPRRQPLLRLTHPAAPARSSRTVSTPDSSASSIRLGSSTPA